MKERIVIAMSGGVDSSIAAALLKEDGYDVIGIFMQIWNYSEEHASSFGSCCSLEDAALARRVAESLKIPFYIINLEKEFQKEVIDYFIREYISGKTPNPCIYCNNKLKFHHLFNYAKAIEATHVATGHYASIDFINGAYMIRKGVDAQKDQSYYLFNLTQDQLRSALFPLGKLTKKEVREKAKKYGLCVAEKPESQEICFIPDNNYSKFISDNVNQEELPEGEIILENGTVLGTHKGIHRYTVGQRKGLGVAWKSPLYVKQVDKKNNRIVVCDAIGLNSNQLIVKDVTWCRVPEDSSLIAEVKIRSHHTPVKASLSVLINGYVEVNFIEPVSAVTPGQAAVFYENDLILGGGWII